MKYTNLEIMKTFNKKNLPSLSTAVLGALELYIKEGATNFSPLVSQFKNPIVVGSGNAKATGVILYQDYCFIADENSYKYALTKHDYDGAIILSASGEKHAAEVAKYYKEKNVKTILLTCNKNSSSEKILGKQNTIVTLKNKEPYTYNTSTYLGWILAKTKEDPKEIYDFIINKVDKVIPKNIGVYKGYLLVTPNKFWRGNHLFHVKFKELFGRNIARDIETYEQLKHAVTVVESDEEGCIQFGTGEVSDIPDERKIRIPLPKNADFGAMMAIGYYVIGKIQENKHRYFEESIEEYISRINKTDFGKNLKVIVE